MDIKQLDYFIKVCEAGSFTQAALKNSISPQGINAAIIRLEKELGKRLFIRHNDGVIITPEGDFLYEKAVLIMKIVDECESYFEKEIIQKQPITISYVTELFCALPAGASDLVVNKYIISIKTQGGSFACEEDLLREESSFALISGPPFNDNLNYKYCFSRKRYLVASKNNPLARRGTLSIKDIKDCEFVMVSPAFKTHSEFTNICKKNGFLPNIVFYTDTLSTTYNMLKTHENWIGLSFDFYIEQNSDPNIVILPINDLDWSWDIYLVYRKDIKLNNTEKNFMTDFLKCFS